MFLKIFIFTTIAASTIATDAATSYSKFNDNQNSVQHIQSAPQQAYYAKPTHQQAYDSKQAPQQASYAKPVPHQAYYAKQAPQQAYYDKPTYYHEPAVQHVPVYESHALPLVAKLTVPVAKLTVPVAHREAPVAHSLSSPSYYHKKQEEQYPDTPAKYSFSYGVQDPHTGDFHSQEEQRDGDHVVGQYSLHEADGTIRIVKYSDDGHGFQAVVEKQGEPTPAPVHYKNY